MTAEIAVVNKNAIALAADSKVTLSTEGQQKTFDTVDKIFSLSKTEPVGAMIYGNAEFMGFPWETVLKEYRRKEPRKNFSTIFDWSDHLLEFLKAFFPFTEDDSILLANIIGSNAIDQIMSRYFNLLKDTPTAEKIVADLIEEYKIHVEELETQPDFLTEDEWNSLGNNYHEIAITLSNQGIIASNDELKALVSRFVILSIRKYIDSPTQSGLVIAGFGEDELLPSLVSYEIEGVIGSKLKCRQVQRRDVTRRNQGFIIPFAQTDMVHRFMEGADPDYVDQLQETIGEMMLKGAIDTAKALGHSEEEIDAIMEPLQTALKTSQQTFWREDQKFRMNRFANPIIDMTMSLPKDELANLAEALVSLTSLQRRVSREMETVGGAIDVAVISKGDGFIWVKRKHYFSPDRNLRFVNGYFSEYGKGKTNGDTNGDNE